jgi:hypothetical protein
MRIALCLYGLVGSYDNKWGLGKPLDISIAYKYYFKNLIQANPNDSVDIFIHSQSCKSKKEIQNVYKPKLALIEKKKDFTFAIKKHPSTKFSLGLIMFFVDLIKFFYNFKSPFFQRKIRTYKLINCYSRWYSSKIVINLKNKYENKNNFKYDIVFLGRLDMAILKPFKLNTFSRSYLTISHSNYFPDKTKTPLEKPSRKIIENIGVYDFWFVGSSLVMDKFSLIYDRIEKYNINPHFTVLQHCAYIGVKIKKKMYRWFDYELIRFKFFDSRI